MKAFGPLAVAVVAALGAPAPARAMTYSCAHRQSFGSDGCDPVCDASHLFYSDNQIDLFSSAMRSAGHTRVHRFADDNVWESDWRDDADGYDDDYYVDNAEVYAYSSHGNRTYVNGQQQYMTPMCWGTEEGACNVTSADIHFGELSGPHAVPSPGSLRFLLLATCYSVHTRPNEQWGANLAEGLEMVFGYQFTSMDTLLTEDVLADFAEEAFIAHNRLKATWMWAAEDFWVNDIPAVITADETGIKARERLRQMRATAPRRNETAPVRAWTWHQG